MTESIINEDKEGKELKYNPKSDENVYSGKLNFM